MERSYCGAGGYSPYAEMGQGGGGGGGDRSSSSGVSCRSLLMHHQTEHTSQPCFHFSHCKLLAGADVGGVRLDDGAAFRMRYRDR